MQPPLRILNEEIKCKNGMIENQFRLYFILFVYIIYIDLYRDFRQGELFS